MATVRALMVGDVVGEGGLAALEALLGPLKAELRLDLMVVNGENAAAGFGMTAETLSRILSAGADVVTGGNHTWEKRELWPTLDAEVRALRPANYPPGLPGRGWTTVERGGCRWFVGNLQGREEMSPIDCPFRGLDRILQEEAADRGDGAEPIRLIDFHAESSQEKEALGLYADGRVTALAGTHTHVQTADGRILSKGTAYITDLGMTGPVAGIIGMDAKVCLDRNRTQVPYKMECATGSAALRGILVEVDAETRRALGIERIERFIPN